MVKMLLLHDGVSDNAGASFARGGTALLKSPRNASCSDPQGICEHLDRRIAHLGAVTATGEG